MSQLSSISSLTSPHPASYAAAAAGSAASGTSSSSAAAHSNMPAGSSDSNKKRRTDTDAQQTALMAQLRELTSNTEATANKVSSMQQWFKKEHIQKPFKLFCNKFKRLLQEQHKANHAVKELTNHKTRGSIPKSMKIKGVSLPQAQASFLQESNEKRIQYEKDQLDIALRCRQAELDSANNEVKNFFTVVTSTITATVTRDDQAVLEFTKQNQTIDLTSVTASLPVPDELINFFLDSIKGSMRDTIISIANSEANLKKKKDDEHSQAMEMDEKVESDPQKSTTELIQLQVAQLVPKELVKLGISTQRSSSSKKKNSGPQNRAQSQKKKISGKPNAKSKSDDSDSEDWSTSTGQRRNKPRRQPSSNKSDNRRVSFKKKNKNQQSSSKKKSNSRSKNSKGPRHGQGPGAGNQGPQRHTKPHSSGSGKGPRRK